LKIKSIFLLHCNQTPWHILHYVSGLFAGKMKRLPWKFFNGPIKAPGQIVAMISFLLLIRARIINE